jgi:hypothetical protein
MEFSLGDSIASLSGATIEHWFFWNLNFSQGGHHA